MRGARTRFRFVRSPFVLGEVEGLSLQWSGVTKQNKVSPPAPAVRVQTSEVVLELEPLLGPSAHLVWFVWTLFDFQDPGSIHRSHGGGK